MRTGGRPSTQMLEQPADDRPPDLFATARAWCHDLPHRPLLLACVTLIVGMMLAHAAPPRAIVFQTIGLAGAAATATLLVLAPRMVLTPALICVLGVGGMLFQRSTEVGPLDLSRMAGAEDCTILGTVIAPPEEGTWRRRVRVEIEGIGRDGRVTSSATGRAEVRIPRKTQLAVGDRVLLTEASVELPAAPEEQDAFDYRAWLARQGVRSLVSARVVEVVGRDESSSARLQRFGMALRERVVGSIEAAMPGADGALYSRLLVGMVYGLQAAPLPEEIVEQFRRAGTVHLLVVSGAQVSMLAIAIVGLTGGSFWRLRWWQAMFAALGVLVLVLIVGMEASVGRAVAMFALVLLAALTARDYDVYTALGFAAALILLFDPQALLSLSLQLTFAATLGVIIFLPRDVIESVPGVRAARPLPQVRAVVWGTVGAWALTTPLLAHSVSGFALNGNVANLVNVPLSGLVLGLGFVELPVALVPGLSPLLWLLCWVARGVLQVVMQVNELAAALPMPFVEGVHLSGLGCVACYAALGLLLALGAHRKASAALDRALVRMHPSSPGVIGIVMAGGLVCSLALAGRPPRQVELTVLPVGAGQCAVIRAPSGATLMADCGGGGNYEGAGREVSDGIIVPWLTRRRIERIDAVSVSHWDTDHANALPRLLDLIPVSTLLMPPELPGAEPPEELGDAVPARPEWAVAGGRLALADGLDVELLAPRMPLLRGTRDDANANSVVMMVTHGEVRALLTGDIDGAAIERLVRDARNTGRSLQADVLVLPHHGRRLAESEPLLDAVRPKWAVASCDDGADRYLGDEEMALLHSRGIRLLRTDDNGAIVMHSDGRRLSMTATRGEHSLGTWVAAARR